MGKAYDKVMESRKELTKQLLAEMEHGKLVWYKDGTTQENVHIIR